MVNSTNDIIKNAKQMINDSTYVYVYGYKGTKVSANGIETLAKQYPKVFTTTIKSLALKKVGKIGIDCSGFVNKSAGTSLGGSTQIKNSSPKIWSISDLTHVQNGMFIWRQGHIGLIEVDSKGNKWILEARGTAYDLTRLSWDIRAKSFTHYGKIKGIEYQSSDSSSTYTNPYPVPTTTLKIGSKGNTVKWLQYQLSQLGMKLSVDGIFGNDTLAKVKQFQKLHSLTVDGIVGKNTLAKLKDS